MSVTVIKDLGRAVRQARDSRTIAQLANDPAAVNYRHPDSAQVSYPKVVNAGPIGTLAASKTPLKVAIVGAGPGGIVALYELSKLATPDRHIEVTIFESDADNFLFQASSSSGQSKVLTQRRAGRVSSYQASNATIYEIGAMRFPEIAGLTWHYAQETLDPTGICKQFPNPGTVPTEFVFGSQYDRYQGDVWLDPDSPTKKVKELVLKGLYGVPYPDLSALQPVYRIGTRTGLEANALLVDPGATEEQLQGFTADWKAFIEENDGTSLEGAVRNILTQYAASLPAVPGLTGKQLISWCVELFGRFGFGTGGFKPLFNISLVEMMRLLLWDYSNEYTFPSDQIPGNVDFIEAIYNKARLNPNLTVTTVKGRVSDVLTLNAFSNDVRGAVIAYYLPGTSAVQFANFDYGVLALPHDVAAQLVSRIGTRGAGITANPVGDFGTARYPDSPANVQRPALLLSSGSDAINARMISAVGTLHMTRSSKVFATITDANSTGPEVPNFNGGKISAIISDSGLAATYMVPSTTTPGYKSFLASYSWDDDSTRLQNTFASWPENNSNDSPTASTMFDAMINRVYRVNPDSPPASNPPKWWLATTLNNVQNVDKVSYDWSTYTTAGGFKLDMTGDTYQSNLCFRFHTHAYLGTRADNPNPDCRFFLAGCSFSHLGGWLEGAFMTAINAVAGITLAANGGREAIGTLNPEAQKLFTTLQPILPMD